MKKIILLLLFFVSQIEYAQNITFTDPDLKTALLNYDTNFDGEISVAEALNVYSLSFTGDYITSLNGIEYFDNTTQLLIYNCPLSLDINSLSGMSNLEHLTINYTISSQSPNFLLFPSLPNLKSVDLFNVNFNTIDLTTLTNCQNIRIESYSSSLSNNFNINNLTQLKNLALAGLLTSQLNLFSNFNLDTITIDHLENISSLEQ